MLKQIHSIQALEVFSVHEANEARSIKAASKPQWFSASPTGTHTKQKNQTLPMKKRSKSDNENDSRMAVDTAFSLEFAWFFFFSFPWMTNGEAAAEANRIQNPINIGDSSAGFFPHVWKRQEIK